MKNLKEKVYSVLKQFPYTRNNDLDLTIRLWMCYYSEYIGFQDGLINDYYVTFKSLFKIPRQDDIKRIRAKIQNPNHKTGYIGMFMPTDENVRKKRKIKEEEWRSYLGYNPELRTE